MASCVHNIRFKVNKVVPLSGGAFCFKYKKRLKKNEKCPPKRAYRIKSFGI